MNNHIATTGMPNMNMNMNSQMMLDNFKSMMLTMAMVKGSSQTDSKNSFMNTLLIMLVVSFIDTIVAQIKKVCGIISMKLETYISKKTNDISILGKITSSYLKIKKASIIIKIESASKNPTSDAIIDILTNLPHTKSILFNNGIYTVNYCEEIEISKGLYAQLVNGPKSQMTANKSSELNQVVNKTDTETQTDVAVDEKNGFGYIDLYSYTLNMEELRDELNTIVKTFLIKMTNKLGNNTYYFSELPMNVYRDGNGKIDHTKSHDSLHFTMKQFVTNRSFKNLFGKDVNIIRKRVEFFKDNKDWYDDKGVPYTLGILVSGNPGSGKTSIIKCIANELKRHIINIHLSDTMTKTQVENLFYNEHIYVTQNGKTETYTIPINKRIYVLEDIDCQCDIILDRENDSIEKILAKKNDDLKKEVEELKYALSELSNGRKMVMTGGKMPELNEKKEADTNQKITLSFLLNLFDGVLETPGRITFMTTNFVDKLDKAFTRPGRIDVIGKFGFADHSQLIAIIEHRYDIKLTEEQINIINNTHQCITPAEISRILFENFNDLDGALEGLVNYVDEYIQNEKRKKNKEIDTQMKIALLENNASDANSKNVDTTNISQIPSDEDNDFMPVYSDPNRTASPMVYYSDPNITVDFQKIEQKPIKATNTSGGKYVFKSSRVEQRMESELLDSKITDFYDGDINQQWGQSNGLNNMKLEQTIKDQMSSYSPSNSYAKWSPI
jgi:DNA replication protein DnaC